VWAKVFVLAVILGFMVFGCSTNQTGKYVPTGVNLGTGFSVINTQTGEVWYYARQEGEWRKQVNAIKE
jgi:hypothetical protein